MIDLQTWNVNASSPDSFIETRKNQKIDSIPRFSTESFQEKGPHPFSYQEDLFLKNKANAATPEITNTLMEALNILSKLYLKIAVQIKKIALIIFQYTKNYFHIINKKINPEISKLEEKDRIRLRQLKMKKLYLNRMRRRNRKQKRKIIENEQKAKEIYYSLYSKSLAYELMDSYGEFDRNTSNLFPLIQKKITRFQEKNRQLERTHKEIKNKSQKIHQEKELILSEKHELENLLNQYFEELQNMKTMEWEYQNKIKLLEEAIEIKEQKLRKVQLSLARLQKILKEKDSESNRLYNEIYSLEETSERNMQTRKDEEERRLEEVRRKNKEISTWEEDFQEKEMQLQKQEEENESLKAKINSLKKKIKSLKEDKSSLKKILEKKKNEALEMENFSLSKYDEQKKKFSSLMNDLKQKESRLREQELLAQSLIEQSEQFKNYISSIEHEKSFFEELIEKEKNKTREVKTNLMKRCIQKDEEIQSLKKEKTQLVRSLYEIKNKPACLRGKKEEKLFLSLQEI